MDWIVGAQIRLKIDETDFLEYGLYDPDSAMGGR